MASMLQPFQLISKAAKAFFKADVRVRRGERGLEVVLDDPEPAGKSAKPDGKAGGKARVDPQQERDRQVLAQVQASLKQLLDELPENRSTLRHLAFIEHALQKKGLRALHKVPYDVLKRALEQFEGVVVNWSDEGLATLRSKMAVTLIEREPEGVVAAAPPEAPNSVTDTAPLAHPVDLEGDDAAEAEAALLAAYGSVVMPELELTPVADDAAVEVQGELNSPSGKALAKAVRRGDAIQPADSRARETHA
jgi:hypothetical protein